MNFPADCKYTKEHEWVRLGDNNTATVGITDFAQSELGELVYLEVETVGKVVAQDAIFGTAEAVKTTSDLFMPVTGKVLEFNTALTDDPSLINSDAYGTGWIIKIEVSNPAELDTLMDAAAARGENAFFVSIRGHAAARSPQIKAITAPATQESGPQIPIQ